MSKRCLILVVVIFCSTLSINAQETDFDQCGFLEYLFVGGHCWLFHADDGSRYEIRGGIDVSAWEGQRVKVVGSFLPQASFCMLGNCCVIPTTVVPCDVFSFNNCGVLIEGDSPDCWLLAAIDGQLLNVPVGMLGFALGDSVRVIGSANTSSPELCSGGTAFLDPDMAWNCCCDGIRGDVDGDGGAIPNVSDLSMMVKYLFYQDIIDYHNSCLEEINVDGELGPGDIPFDVNDLTHIVGYLFKGGNQPADCPQWNGVGDTLSH